MRTANSTSRQHAIYSNGRIRPEYRRRSTAIGCASWHILSGFSISTDGPTSMPSIPPRAICTVNMKKGKWSRTCWGSSDAQPTPLRRCVRFAGTTAHNTKRTPVEYDKLDKMTLTTIPARGQFLAAVHRFQRALQRLIQLWFYQKDSWSYAMSHPLFAIARSFAYHAELVRIECKSECVSRAH
jgi:hypothetical protein